MGGCLRVWEFWGVRATLGSGSYSRDWYLFGKVRLSTFVNTYTTYRIFIFALLGAIYSQIILMFLSDWYLFGKSSWGFALAKN
jgi:hypothetical protein